MRTEPFNGLRLTRRVEGAAVVLAVWLAWLLGGFLFG